MRFCACEYRAELRDVVACDHSGFDGCSQLTTVAGLLPDLALTSPVP
jgi:hypothetical protein